MELLEEDFTNGNLSKELFEAECFAKAMSNIRRRGEAVPDLTEEQMEEVIQNAAKMAIQEAISSLVEKELVQVSLTADCDFAFSLTETGKIAQQELAKQKGKA